MTQKQKQQPTQDEPTPQAPERTSTQHHPDPADADAEARAFARAARAVAQLGWAEPAALLAVLSEPGAEHRALAEAYGLTTKALTRATAKAADAGLLVGRAGAWVPVLPSPDGTLPADAAAPDIRRRLAERLAAAEGHGLKFRGQRFSSLLERDVALALTAVGWKYETQVPYSTILDTDRAWTADYLLKLRVGDQVVQVIVEATGRADAAAALDEKLAAARTAGVPVVVVRGPGDLVGLWPALVATAKSAAEAAARSKAQAPAEPADSRWQKPYVNAGGVYIDPRAVRRPGTPVSPPPPRVPDYSHLPPLPPPDPIPGIDLADWEIRHVHELEESERDALLKKRLAQARAYAHAEYGKMMDAEAPADRARRLLAAEREKWRQERLAALAAEDARPAPEPVDAAAWARAMAESETELTGEECAERDEVPDPWESGS